MKTRTLKLVLEYDGTRYAGWQIQTNARTVQGVIEEALEKILHHPARLIAAGRTDAGVHATGQVAGFTTSSIMGTERLKRALNGVLSRDVTVVELEQVRDDFNARYDARSRTYRYTVTERRLSVGRSYAWHVPYKLDRNLLASSTVYLRGACNLRGFSKGNDKDDYSTIIFKNRWIFDGALSIFEITGVRFFHHAVRSIIGSAVKVASGRASPDLLQRILETRNKKLAGPTAPASGLCLVAVEYGDEHDDTYENHEAAND